MVLILVFSALRKNEKHRGSKLLNELEAMVKKRTLLIFESK
jgi:hypothetical protein